MGVPAVGVKSVRLLGNDPGDWVASARKVPVAGAIAADGVAVAVTVAFCVTGAVVAAERLMVKLWPGEKTLGEKVAVVPGGRPLTEGVISKSTFWALTLQVNWVDPEPPMGTPTSPGCAGER